jgi:DNA modification methylase
LILFGGSGSEIEVAKSLGRHFISAEIDKKYYDVIMDRLKHGTIREEHRLKLRNGARVANHVEPVLWGWR